jgi:hypothetical protein
MQFRKYSWLFRYVLFCGNMQRIAYPSLALLALELVIHNKIRPNFCKRSRKFLQTPCKIYQICEAQLATSADPSSNTLTRLLSRPLDECVRRSRTASARLSKTSTVLSQLMHASVMLTPFFKPAGPSAGTFWLPSLIFDSIMTPIMEFSPARS